MILYEKAGSQRFLAPYVEMYPVRDIPMLEEALHAIRHAIENHDYSRMEQFYAEKIAHCSTQARSKTWEIRADQFADFLSRIEEAQRQRPSEERARSIQAIRQKFAAVDARVALPALKYHDALGMLRQINRVLSHPEGFGSLGDRYFERFDEALSALASDDEAAFDPYDFGFDMEHYVSADGYYLDDKQIPLESISSLDKVQIKRLQVRSSRAPDGEDFWWFSGIQFPHSWTTTMMQLCIGPLERSMGPLYFAMPPVGESILPESWKPHPLFCHEYPGGAGRGWRRIPNSEMDRVIAWAASAEVSTSEWWDESRSEEYQWDSQWNDAWPEVKREMVEGCRKAKEEQADLLWRIQYPEELDL
jgi:hypothetical protein